MKRMCSLIIISILVLMIGGCSNDSGGPSEPEEGSIKVLFIGNSFTYHYDTPGIFRELAESAGKKVFVVDKCIGNASLTYHSMYSPTVEAIYEEQWDYVVLQEANYGIISPNSNYDDRPVEILRNFVLQNNPDAKIVFYLVWADREGYGEYDFNELSQYLRDGTKVIADRYDMLIAPVGWAWKHVMNEYPDLNLYQWDYMHPNLAGAYLQACVYYSTIFRESSVGNIYKGDLPEGYTSYFQQVASEIVLNELEYWNLID